MSKALSIPKAFETISEKWSPHLVAAVNEEHIKIAKIDGAFIWHAHPNSDELFYVLSGKLTMELEGHEPVVMGEGDVFVVPRNVRHRPVAENAHILMVERYDTVNTGEEKDSDRTRMPVDIRQPSS